MLPVFAIVQATASAAPRIAITKKCFLCMTGLMAVEMFTISRFIYHSLLFQHLLFWPGSPQRAFLKA
jgi:hypothetical protein